MVVIGKRPIRLSVGAGHRNTFINGNPYEREMNGKKVHALLDHLDSMPRDIDYECYTPNRGLGLYPGTYNDAARSVVSHAAETGWIPDIFLEIHSQGLSNTSIRGSFVIYPDERHIAGGNDVDVDVRVHGDVFARYLREKTGIPLYPPQGIDGVSGIMSEQETGVGSDGFRLGVFAVTEVLKDTTSRLIFESGTHSNPTDREIMDSPPFLEKFAQATAYAIRDFAEFSMGWIPSSSTYPPVDTLLRETLGDKNHIPFEGARVYRFRDIVAFTDEAMPQRHADKNAPLVANPRPPFDQFRVVGIIAKKNGEKWFLGVDDARYLMTGNEFTVL